MMFIITLTVSYSIEHLFRNQMVLFFQIGATMYMVGIEDRDYKEDKVECKLNFIYSVILFSKLFI